MSDNRFTENDRVDFPNFFNNPLNQKTYSFSLPEPQETNERISNLDGRQADLVKRRSAYIKPGQDSVGQVFADYKQGQENEKRERYRQIFYNPENRRFRPRKFPDLRPNRSAYFERDLTPYDRLKKKLRKDDKDVIIFEDNGKDLSDIEFKEQKKAPEIIREISTGQKVERFKDPISQKKDREELGPKKSTYQNRPPKTIKDRKPKGLNQSLAVIIEKEKSIFDSEIMVQRLAKTKTNRVDLNQEKKTGDNNG